MEGCQISKSGTGNESLERDETSAAWGGGRAEAKNRGMEVRRARSPWVAETVAAVGLTGEAWSVVSELLLEKEGSQVRAWQDALVWHKRSFPIARIVAQERLEPLELQIKGNAKITYHVGL